MSPPQEVEVATASSSPARSSVATTSRVLLTIAVISASIVTGMIHFIPALGGLSDLGRDGGLLIVKFLLAIALIIAIGRLGGWIASRIGQPRVIGEMVAGIALGPSLFGRFVPGAQHWLFPAELMPHLGLIAQLAVIVFMFLLGANLPLGLLRGSGSKAAALGTGMVAVPVLGGIGLATGLAESYRPSDVPLAPFLLFVGVSMGVTAFPVLVRILDEHGLIKTRIGALGLTAAGIGDVIAWCLLVVAVAAINDDSTAAAVRTVGGLVAFILIVWTFLRPALRHLLVLAEKNILAQASSTSVLLLCAVSGAYITEWIGIHAIFGAFLIGMAVPRETALIGRRMKSIERGMTSVLPLFFAVVGLNVAIDFIFSSLQDVLVCALVLVVAITSKLGTTYVIARLTRQQPRDALGLGIMMNCRGLTELVVISTGLSLGIIGQDLFVIFVVMTLVTTMMTGPLISRLRLKGGAGNEPADSQSDRVEGRAGTIVTSG